MKKGDKDIGKCQLAYSMDFSEWVAEQALRGVVGGQILLGAGWEVVENHDCLHVKEEESC